MVIDGKLNPNIVGQSIPKLAELFGIKVPQGTKVLIGEVEKIGPEEALSQVRGGVWAGVGVVGWAGLDAGSGGRVAEGVAAGRGWGMRACGRAK